MASSCGSAQAVQDVAGNPLDLGVASFQATHPLSAAGRHNRTAGRVTAKHRRTRLLDAPLRALAVEGFRHPEQRLIEFGAQAGGRGAKDPKTLGRAVAM